MKKTFFTLLFFICILSANAQKVKSGGVTNNLSVGPIVGVNFSTLRGSDANAEFKAGFSGGLFANYSILDNFGVTAQVLYSMQGAKNKTTGDALKLNYFQIPVMFMCYLRKPGDTFRPKIMLGPQFGFLAGAKQGSKDVKDAFTSNDISGVLGLGFNYSVGKGMWLNVDARYAHGFTDVFKPFLGAQPDAKNSVISVMAGISFAFGNYEDL